MDTNRLGWTALDEFSCYIDAIFWICEPDWTIVDNDLAEGVSAISPFAHDYPGSLPVAM